MSTRRKPRKPAPQAAARARKSEARKAPAAAASARKAALRSRSGVQRPKEPAASTQTYPIGKDRKQLKGIAIYMHPLAKDVLDKIALEQKRTVQELGLEALNLLFRHYGEKPIA